jgi:hypothetical protein
MSNSMQLRHLEQAERHIVQMALTRLDISIERLRSKHLSTEREERSREIMEQTLDLYYGHREMILSEMYGGARSRSVTPSWPFPAHKPNDIQ